MCVVNMWVHDYVSLYIHECTGDPGFAPALTLGPWHLLLHRMQEVQLSPNTGEVSLPEVLDPNAGMTMLETRALKVESLAIQG